MRVLRSDLALNGIESFASHTIPPPFREHLLSDRPLLDWKVSSVQSEMACSVQGIQEARFQWPEKDTRGALYGAGQEWVDLHESGTIGYALKRTSTDICFCFLNFTLENLKRLQNSEPFHAKMYPTSCLCLHRILSSYWLAHFCSLLYFGLDCGMLEFFTHEP